MKAQASAELLVIIAVMGIAMLPMLLVMGTSAQKGPDTLALGKAVFSSARLASSVNAVGSLGLGSAVGASVEFPDGAVVSAMGREISVRVMTSSGPVDIVQSTRFNVTGVGLERITREGTYLIDVQAGPTPEKSDVSITLR